MLIDKLRSRDLIGRSRKKKKNDKGFTLIELLVVITILGILAAVIIFAVTGITDKGKAAAASTDDSIQRTAQEAYCHEKGTYADPSVMQRDGLLSSGSHYNDGFVDTTTGNCGGTSFAVFKPQKSYTDGKTVTVKDCLGNITTYTAAPSRPFVLDSQSFETMMYLSLLGKTVPGARLPSYLVPSQFKTDFTNNQDTFPWFVNPNNNTGTTGTANPDVPKITQTARRLTQTQITGMTTKPDFYYGDSLSEFTRTGAANTDNDYDLAAFQSTAGATAKLYAGYSYGGCWNDKKRGNPDEPNSTLVDNARSSLEGVFTDIRNIGMIFDVQEKAAQVIGDMRNRIAAAVQRAALGRGTVVLPTYYDSTSTSYGLFGGSTGMSGAVSLVGGKNPFDDQFPANGGLGLTSAAQIIGKFPGIIVGMAFAPNAQGQPDCTSAGSDFAPGSPLLTALAGTPAVTKNRLVCVWYNYMIASSIGSVDTIERMANELAKGP